MGEIHPVNSELHSEGSDTQTGIALLIVLWILTILMVVVLSFSYLIKTEMLATLSFKGGMERKLLAEGGVERGIMELFYRNVYKNQTVELEGREVWRVDGTSHTGQVGDGFYTTRIIDESGKVDINTVSEVLLKNLVVNAGIQAEEADVVVDSIMDWKDPDDLHRLHGAESDYYMSLANPYEAKNARFDSLEELLLVKGVTPEILYGSNEKKGIINFLTVHSKRNTVNVNAAPKEVLLAVPGITPELADAIISYREGKEIQDLAEIQGIVGDSNPLAPYLSTQGADTFTIEASGYRENEKGVYAVRATVTLSGENTYKYVYYKSPVTLTQ
jgi:general secretion pathway protein K